MSDDIEARLKKADEVWTGPRFVVTIFISMAIALTIIFLIASVKHGNYSWYPFAHQAIHHM